MQYSGGMKPVLCLASLFVASWALADSASDRAAIVSLITALNDHSKPPSSLLTADAAADPAELARLSNLDRMLAPSKGPLSEVTAPKIEIRSVRFITRDVALVDAVNSQYGSVILSKSVPLLVVMKKQGKNWRIASLRVMVDSAKLPPLG